MKYILLLISLLIFNIGYSQQVKKQISVFQDGSNRTIGFFQFTPPNYNLGNKHPLIIFLHGNGERGFNGTTGTDITTIDPVASNEIPKLLTGSATMNFTYAGVTKSFIVLSPQLSSQYTSWPNWYVLEMIKYAKSNLNIDTNRIYLTGLSLGGGGVWDATENITIASQLAAVSTVCATCTYNQTLSKIISLSIPVWSFHAIDDGVVSVSCTDNAVSQINSIMPNLAKYTRYTNGNHFIWNRAYDTTHNIQNPNLYEWFLQFNKNRSLPLTFKNIYVTRISTTTIKVEFEVFTDIKVSNYYIKISEDGINFRTIKIIDGEQILNTNKIYSVIIEQ